MELFELLQKKNNTMELFELLESHEYCRCLGG